MSPAWRLQNAAVRIPPTLAIDSGGVNPLVPDRIFQIANVLANRRGFRLRRTLGRQHECLQLGDYKTRQCAFPPPSRSTQEESIHSFQIEFFKSRTFWLIAEALDCVERWGGSTNVSSLAITKRGSAHSPHPRDRLRRSQSTHSRSNFSNRERSG